MRFSSLLVTQEFVVNFHQARDELLAPWAAVESWCLFGGTLFLTLNLGGVPGPANYCIAIYVYIYILILGSGIQVWLQNKLPNWGWNSTGSSILFTSPQLLAHTHTPTRTSWMIRVCLKLFDVICYIVFEYNFQSIDGFSMNLPFSCFKSFGFISYQTCPSTTDLSPSLPVSESCTANYSELFCQERENPQIVVKKKYIRESPPKSPEF